MDEDLDGEEIVGTFQEKELQKTNQTEFRIEKMIKKKGYDNSLNGWIDKKVGLISLYKMKLNLT